MRTSKQNQAGFTIIELMIASTVFSVVLLLCTFGLIQIGRVYYKGTISVRTQETARNVIDTIAQNIQFGNYEPIGDGSEGFCAGGKRFSYLEGVRRTTNSPNVLVVDEPTACGNSSPIQDIANGSLDPDTNSQELIGEGMWLLDLNIDDACADSSLCDITVTVASGTFEDLDPLNARQCRGGAGSQFCAVSSLSTTVQKRVE